MSETKIISIAEAMEITQEIPEIFAQLLELYDAEVEFVELGVEDDQIVIREVEKSNPTVSSVHVPSTDWDKKQLLVSKAIDEEKRYTLSPWYIPDSLDAHDEWTDKEEIQRAFWDYLSKPDRTIKLQHNTDIIAGKWVEGLTWPHEVTVPIKHPDGDVEITFPSGTPFLGVIWEPWAWQLIKDGEIRGLSIGGKGKRIEQDQEDYSYKNTGGASFTKTQTDFFEESEGVVPVATLDIIKTFIESITKHLPGKHDQSSHGRGNPNFPKVKDIPVQDNRDLEAAALGIELRKKYAAVENERTELLSNLAFSKGGELSGLAYRLKDSDSLARKIEADSIKKELPMSEIAENGIYDVNRYTMKFDESDFTANAQSTLDDLRQDGYTVMEVKNTLKAPNAQYRGVNVKLEKDGLKMELQFHTPASSEAKTINHEIYKAWRESTDPAVMNSLDAQMVANSAAIPTPQGIDSLE